MSRGADGTLHRHTWAEVYERTAKLAHALARLGVKPGDRVATLAWNHHRHLEAYFAAPMMGAVVHTLNLRLHPTEIGYIARHAEDSVVLVDRSLLPLFDQFAASVPEHPPRRRDAATAGRRPRGKLDYEALIAPEAGEYDWPRLDENAAAQICYTSGTTGNPKGVVYSHRSSVLHALAACLADSLAISMNDTMLPVVPMFHANAWGLPHACAAVGREDGLPRAEARSGEPARSHGDASASRARGGVPTIWLGILALLDAHPKKWDLSSLRQMVVGGSAAPRVDDGGLREAPRPDRHARLGHDRDEPARHDRARQARPGRTALRGAPRACARRRAMAVPFVETRHADDAGKVLPVGRRDDGRARGARALGRLVVHGRRGQGPLDAATAGSRPATS